jgi:RNA polymerase sigma-70 factor (ECF subfamily)
MDDSITRGSFVAEGQVVVDGVAPVPDVSRLQDPEQFRVFYAEALPRVYGYFLSRCGAEIALAEDLTQETFLAAVAELRRGCAVVTPLPWVLGIARHKLLDHFRRQRRTGWTMVSWESAVDDTDETLIVPDDDAGRDRAIATLARVPSPQREALILHYLDGLSVAEVAALLERSISATTSLLARGRVSFRQALAEARDA